MKGCNNMNKEQIKKFWEDHKVEIIGGTLVLVSLAIIGTSVGSAINANKLEAKKAAEASEKYSNFCNEMVALGATMKSGNPYPVATREVVEKILNEGEAYLLNGLNKGVTEIIIIDSKTIDDLGLRAYV